MKIATWNVERLKHIKSLSEIISACEKIKADVLVLTESDERVKLNYRYSFHTPTPTPLMIKGYEVPITYAQTEHRVSVYTNYPIVRQHDTFDPYTSICHELETEKGNILVYGTIIGVAGNRDSSFEHDLKRQTEDFHRLTADGHSLCICGDYNCSFADNYYFTTSGRKQLNDSFLQNGIDLLTASCPSCIDHVAVSRQFVGESMVNITEWNKDKSLSDHKGVSVEFD